MKEVSLEKERNVIFPKRNSGWTLVEDKWKYTMKDACEDFKMDHVLPFVERLVNGTRNWVYLSRDLFFAAFPDLLSVLDAWSVGKPFSVHFVPNEIRSISLNCPYCNQALVLFIFRGDF